MTTTVVKERPILFSGPMVRAILDGRKTRTRRVVKPQPDREFDFDPPVFFNSEGVWAHPNWTIGEYDNPCIHVWKCPFGLPGDRLWVRETWADLRGMGFGAKVAYRSDSMRTDGTMDADSERCRRDYEVKWKPSIHMPRWASRITLEVTGVRVERVQEITPHEALAEGADYQHAHECPPDFRAKLWFSELWDSLNAKRGYSWDANPWVWVIEFKRVGDVD